jgi:hypothetical protein
MPARNGTKTTPTASNGVHKMYTPQHIAALAKANAHRYAQARDLHLLKHGEITFSELDLGADHLRTLRVVRLLAYLPWWRRRERSRLALLLIAQGGSNGRLL